MQSVVFPSALCFVFCSFTVLLTTLINLVFSNKMVNPLYQVVDTMRNLEIINLCFVSLDVYTGNC